MIQKLLLTGVAVLALSAGAGLAQTSAKFGTDNRAMTIGDLSDTQALATLRKHGRVSMSGAFFDTNSAALTPGAGEVLAKLARVLEALPDARLRWAECQFPQLLHPVTLTYPPSVGQFLT